jgi:AcrR family transcriptional regulator
VSRRVASGTRERILDAALELFAEAGFQGTTISEVERRVGLAPGTGSFYRHFPSKEALLQAAVDREVERIEAEIFGARAALPSFEDAQEQREFMLSVALRDLRRFERLFRLMITEGERVPELARAITTSLQRAGERMEGQADPVLVVTLAALGGYHLFSVMQGRPFQGMPEADFIAALAALTPSS